MNLGSNIHLLPVVYGYLVSFPFITAASEALLLHMRASTAWNSYSQYSNLLLLQATVGVNTRLGFAYLNMGLEIMLIDIRKYIVCIFCVVMYCFICQIGDTSLDVNLWKGIQRLV